MMTLPVPRNASYPGCQCDACGPEPFRSMHAALYSFNHPTVQRIKLGAVKTALYNPCLASLRRYEMDTFCGKPPEEHSQNTTTLCREDFCDAKETFAVCPLRFRVPGLELSDRRFRRHYAPEQEISKATRAFQDHLHFADCADKPDVAPIYLRPTRGPDCDDMPIVDVDLTPVTPLLPSQTRIGKDQHASCVHFLPCTKFKRPPSFWPRRSVKDTLGLDRWDRQRMVHYEKLAQHRQHWNTWSQSPNPISWDPWLKY